jgi:circadian clock protein KaiB
VITQQDLALEAPESVPFDLSESDYDLTLFVNGASDRSAQAIANVRALCDAYLAGRFHLEIVDVHQNIALVIRHGVLASPTLLKERPLPARMIVGDLSDQGRVLVKLGIWAVPHMSSPPHEQSPT